MGDDKRSRNGRWRRRIRLALLGVGLIAGVPLGYYLYEGLWKSNFHAVVDGQVYRSRAPWGDDIDDWCRQFGLKTIVDLRADGVSRRYPKEDAAAARNGAKMVYLRLRTSRKPDATKLRKLIRIIETAPKPMLVHCQAGADRAGLASFIAAMAIGGQSYKQAEGQFSLKYFHVKTDLPITRVLHDYRHWCRRSGLPTAGWTQFRHWAFAVNGPSPARACPS